MEKVFSENEIAALLKWYGESRRDLPWRRTKDPYKIWLSEIMLQQTRVEAVKPYYERFLATAPTVKDLANLPEDKLLKLWEGLGYYSRARNLQKAAKTVVEQYGGVMPRDFSSLRKLSGIGDYTAGAVASIAFGERVPAVDGNVLRVIARAKGRYDDISLPETKKAFSTALSAVIPEEAGDFNQSLIELGATVCVPNGKAKCESCPLRNGCAANRNDLQEILPVKAPKKPRKVLDLTVFVIQDGNRTVLHKRPEKGLLAGLFELPNTQGHLSLDQVAPFLERLGLQALQVRPIGEAKHIFTHIEWHMVGYAVRISPDFDGFPTESGLILPDYEELKANYALPSAFSAYVKYLSEKYY